MISLTNTTGGITVGDQIALPASLSSYHNKVGQRRYREGERGLFYYFPFSSIRRKVNIGCCARVPGDLLKGDTKVNIASAAGTFAVLQTN